MSRLMLPLFIWGLLFTAHSQTTRGSFIISDIWILGGRSSVEDRVLISMQLHGDYYPGSSMIFSGGIGTEFNVGPSFLSYDGGVGFVLSGKSGYAHTSGAWFGSDGGNTTTYSYASGQAKYTKLQLFELGIRGRSGYISDCYYDAYEGALIDDKTILNETYGTVGYRYIAANDVLFPTWQEISIAVKGLAGYRQTDLEYYEDQTLVSSTEGENELTFGGLIEMRYYMLAGEFGYIGDNTYWSAYMRIPFSTFLD